MLQHVTKGLAILALISITGCPPVQTKASQPIGNATIASLNAMSAAPSSPCGSANLLETRVYWKGGDLYLQSGLEAPVRIDRIVSTQKPNGDTRIELVLGGGKIEHADILAGGRELIYKGYDIDLK